jgi:hypothetical protein
MTARPRQTWPVALGLVLMASGVLVLIDLAGWVSIAPGAVVALTLVIAGVALLLSTLVGRTGGSEHGGDAGQIERETF